jgi:hypothetical protein
MAVQVSTVAHGDWTIAAICPACVLNLFVAEAPDSVATQLSGVEVAPRVAVTTSRAQAAGDVRSFAATLRL